MVTSGVCLLLTQGKEGWAGPKNGKCASSDSQAAGHTGLWTLWWPAGAQDMSGHCGSEKGGLAAHACTGGGLWTPRPLPWAQHRGKRREGRLWELPTFPASTPPAQRFVDLGMFPPEATKSRSKTEKQEALGLAVAGRGEGHNKGKPLLPSPPGPRVFCSPEVWVLKRPSPPLGNQGWLTPPLYRGDK